MIKTKTNINQGENKMETLTIENASKVSTITNKNNPEWGAKRFNHNAQALNDGKAMSTCGVGCNSSLLDEGEYKFWNVSTWK
jgi:hypothetical protein